MNRSLRCIVFGAATVIGLLTYQNGVRAGDSATVLPVMLESSDAPAAPCASEADCATCAPMCESACRPCRHVVVGAEAVFLSRQGDQGTATFDITDGTTNYGSYSAGAAGNNDLVVSPRLMMGLQGECWGMDVRYWRMREPDIFNDLGVISATDGTATMAESVFKAETLDLEATYLFYRGITQMQVALGARYAQLEQSSLLNVCQPLNGNYYTGTALASHGFHGAGITGALTALRPVGNRNFNLFCNVRASILWDGNATNSVYTRAAYEHSTGGWSKAFDAATASSAGNLFIGEVQVGGQWDFPLKCIRANAFLRGAIEYQYWGTNDTGLAGCYSGAGVQGGTYGLAQAQSTNNYVNLVGFNVGTGLTW